MTGQKKKKNYYENTRSGSASRVSSGGIRRKAAARRRRIRQRRLILAGICMTLILMIGGIAYGIFHYRQDQKCKGFRQEGIACMEEGDYEAAIRFLDQALKNSGRRIGKFEKDVLQYRAEAEYKLQDYPAALHTWELLLQEDGDEVLYKKGIVLCLLGQGNFQEALSYGVLESRIYNDMAAACIQAGQYQQALEAVEKGKAAALAESASADQNMESALKELSFNEAVVWEYLGDFAKALELFEAYVSTYGSDEQAEREIRFLKTR